MVTTQVATVETFDRARVVVEMTREGRRYSTTTLHLEVRERGGTWRRTGTRLQLPPGAVFGLRYALDAAEAALAREKAAG